MNVALCVAFLEKGVWERRLKTAALLQMIEITECNSVKALLKDTGTKVIFATNCCVKRRGGHYSICSSIHIARNGRWHGGKSLSGRFCRGPKLV